MQNMRVFVSVQVTGLFLYVMLWADRKHMVARKSVYCLYSHGCACVWQWFLVCSWRLGASKICVVFCAGSETPDCVGVKCTDSWQTAAFPVILRSPPRLWPVMRLLRKILLLLGACLNMSCRYQSNALDIPLEGKLNKWLSFLCIISVVFFLSFSVVSYWFIYLIRFSALFQFSCLPFAHFGLFLLPSGRKMIYGSLFHPQIKK